MGEAKRRREAREAREKARHIRPSRKSKWLAVIRAALKKEQRKAFFANLQGWLDARRPK